MTTKGPLGEKSTTVQAQHARLAPLLLMLLCVVSVGAWIAFLVWAAGHLTGAW
jgi:hypothetical protein